MSTITNLQSRHSITATREAVAALARDLVTLTKPRVTGMNILMTLGAMMLAPGTPDLQLIVCALLGTTFAVASANSLNMVLERRSDGLMRRTQTRPLPQGRVPTWVAAYFGICLALGSLMLLGWAVNTPTMLLGALALAMYVLVYTPLKKHTPLALIIGAVPGAMPPLMGWTAATGSINATGLALFAILFVWQLPHFLAITIYLKNDYARAGIKTVAVVRGDSAARTQARLYALLLIPVSLILVPLGVAGALYAVAALALGVWFLSVGMRGFQPSAGARWARRFFFASLIYLPALIGALLIDTSLGL